MNVKSNTSSKQTEHFSVGHTSSNGTSCLVNSFSNVSAWANRPASMLRSISLQSCDNEGYESAVG